MQRSDTPTADQLAALGLLTPVQVRRARALALVYPVAAALAVLLLGVSAGRVAAVTVFFALWVTVQLLALSPACRRQVLGLPAAREGLGR
jgi:hypothetical protein